MFLAYKTSKCKFYDVLDSIYGSKANVTIPYVYDSLQNQKIGETQTNESENNVPANVIGEMVHNSNGDVIESNLTDGELDRMSVINVDSFFSALEENDINTDSQEIRSSCNGENLIQQPHSDSDTGDTQHTQSDVECLDPVFDITDLPDQERRLDPVNEDVQSTQSDHDVECLRQVFDRVDQVPNLRETSSRTNDSAATRTSSTISITDDEIAFSNYASTFFDCDRSDEHEQGNEAELEQRNESRIARYKHQLSERSSSQPHKRNIPSNAAAFVSDANLKRAETLHERNKIEMRRVENENIEISINKQRFELDKILLVEQMQLNKKELSHKDEELILKEKELSAKFDLRTQHFELKCKKLALKDKEKEEEFKLKLLEIEKKERLERMKIEYDYKLQLELAKMKSTW